MKKKYYLVLIILTVFTVKGQVGINTTTPKATIDVVGKPSQTTEIDGFLPPRISRIELINKTVYSTDQIGVLIYVTDLSGTVNAATVSVTKVGYYYFDGSIWKSIGDNVNSFGDVKQGFQTTDHNGWIKLNGRLKSTLTVAQQTQATALGIGTNLPDATNAVLLQNGTAVGTVAGSNTKTIAQNQLPNVTLGGTTSTDGAHTHGYITPYGSGSLYSQYGDPRYNFGEIIQTESAGDHIHSITTSSINGNVAQQNLDITPKSLSANTFIYLGN